MARFRDLNDKSGRRPRAVSDEEQALWRDAMRGTKVIEAGRLAPPVHLRSVPIPPGAGDNGPVGPRTASVVDGESVGAGSPSRSFGAAAPTLVPGHLADMDKRTAERFRKGVFPIDRRIDLHGMTQDHAQRALARFIADSHTAGARCVLVITGKGTPRGEGSDTKGGDGDWFAKRGILKDAVPRWLSEGPNRGRIVAINPALPRHGGAGALYVLLRRHRDR